MLVENDFLVISRKNIVIKCLTKETYRQFTYAVRDFTPRQRRGWTRYVKSHFEKFLIWVTLDGTEATKTVQLSVIWVFRLCASDFWKQVDEWQIDE